MMYGAGDVVGDAVPIYDVFFRGFGCLLQRVEFRFLSAIVVFAAMSNGQGCNYKCVG